MKKNRRQAIGRTDDDAVRWLMYASIDRMVYMNMFTGKWKFWELGAMNWTVSAVSVCSQRLAQYPVEIWCSMMTWETNVAD